MAVIQVSNHFGGHRFIPTRNINYFEITHDNRVIIKVKGDTASFDGKFPDGQLKETFAADVFDLDNGKLITLEPFSEITEEQFPGE